MSAESDFSDSLRRLEIAVIERLLVLLEKRLGVMTLHISALPGGTADRIRALRGRLHNCPPDEWGYRELQETPPEKRPSGLPDVQAAQAPAQAGRKAKTANERSAQGRRVRRRA